jgi:uncharacterized membrane protein YhaH (DUF805 family)
MSFMFQPLRKYADFKGRARRAEYWQFTLLVFGIQFVAMILVASTMGDLQNRPPNPVNLGILGIYGVIMLGLLIPGIAVSFRRLHDVNLTAWWSLIAFLPVLGGLVLLVFTLLDGTPGDNKYGPDPKGRSKPELVPA